VGSNWLLVGHNDPFAPGVQLACCLPPGKIGTILDTGGVLDTGSVSLGVTIPRACENVATVVLIAASLAASCVPPTCAADGCSPLIAVLRCTRHTAPSVGAPTPVALKNWLGASVNCCPPWVMFTTPWKPKKRVVTLDGPPPACAVARITSVMKTVPRTPATAFDVRTSMLSPGRILSRATASAILPASRSIVDLPGTSVIVSDERSRTVTTALPPSSIRAIALSPVVTLSFTKTSSLNLSGCGCGSATRVTVTLPSSVVTTPARGASPKTRVRQNVEPARMAAAGRRNRDMRSPELCELTGDRVAARRASGAENLVEPVQGPEPRAIYVGDDHCRIGTRRQPKLSESQRGGANPAPRGSTSGLTGTWVR